MIHISVRLCVIKAKEAQWSVFEEGRRHQSWTVAAFPACQSSLMWFTHMRTDLFHVHILVKDTQKGGGGCKLLVRSNSQSTHYFSLKTVWGAGGVLCLLSSKKKNSVGVELAVAFGVFVCGNV